MFAFITRAILLCTCGFLWGVLMATFADPAWSTVLSLLGGLAIGTVAVASGYLAIDWS